MTWTAKITWLGPSTDTQIAHVELSDGKTVISDKYTTNGTMASLLPQLVQRVSVVATKPASDLVEGATFAVAPTIAQKPAAPTDDELARRDFFDAYQNVLRIERGIDAGLIAADDKSYLAARDLAQKLYLPDYVSLL